MTRIVLREANDLMRSLDAESVQVIVADPPYGIAYHSNRYVERNPHAPVARDWNFQIGPFLNAAARALHDGGALYLFTRWDVYPLWASSVAPPLHLQNVIVWLKDNHSAGDLTGDFGNKYEQIMWLTKGRHKRRGHRWSNVWEFPRVPSKKMLHPTQKPVALVARAIEASSDPGGLVVDPFCGSGTTGEAARACGRHFVLGDIDPNMIRIACKRLGLAAPDGIEEVASSTPPECPVFGVVPPAPHLWGVHPEDLAYALAREKEERLDSVRPPGPPSSPGPYCYCGAVNMARSRQAAFDPVTRVTHRIEACDGPERESPAAGQAGKEPNHG